jgi:hypothetical protein
VVYGSLIALDSGISVELSIKDFLSAKVSARSNYRNFFCFLVFGLPDKKLKQLRLSIACTQDGRILKLCPVHDIPMWKYEVNVYPQNSLHKEITYKHADWYKTRHGLRPLSAR